MSVVRRAGRFIARLSNVARQTAHEEVCSFNSISEDFFLSGLNLWSARMAVSRNAMGSMPRRLWLQAQAGGAARRTFSTGTGGAAEVRAGTSMQARGLHTIRSNKYYKGHQSDEV